ncbi:MAG: glycogen synthase GlgA [Candidatus Heimdallarchaeota archaeon]|nr:glycogen synthase GlgA [Candidatus Heimdallarchaeota archaeon]MCK4770965.1 glycogen synthase GlgA [Candidatus Heimdallarchaeota archaeon]
MKIAFISAEVAPFSKTGGLGDVSSAFPKAMQGLKHRILIMSPLYKTIDAKKFRLQNIKKNLTVSIGDKTEIFDLYVSFVPHSKVPIYFIKNSYLFRDGIYGNEKGEDYPDSAYRFITFTKAVFEALKWLKFSPDIIHANDWHTGLLPFYLKTEYREIDLFRKTKSVFTIHNIGYQGIYPLEDIAEAQIPDVYFSEELLGFYDQINFMKAAVVYSDALTTVSSKYSEEIQTKEFGYGLEEYIKERKDDLFGIVHGIDLTVWSPKNDKLLVKRYDSKSLNKKAENKSYLQEKLNLNLSKEPVLGIISRLATQKGLDLILEKFDDMMDLKVQIILLGTGDPELEKEFKEKEKKYPEECSINIMFDNVLAHQIEAASDMFLMPSAYEPCGLNQMYSMLYGAVPIVRNTGGLSDTVEDYNKDTEEGSGFVFETMDADEFFDAVKRAVKIYKEEPEKWIKLQRKVMDKDFSWKNAAKQWEQVYQYALDKK